MFNGLLDYLIVSTRSGKGLILTKVFRLTYALLYALKKQRSYCEGYAIRVPVPIQFASFPAKQAIFFCQPLEFEGWLHILLLLTQTGCITLKYLHTFHDLHIIVHHVLRLLVVPVQV